MFQGGCTVRQCSTRTCAGTTPLLARQPMDAAHTTSCRDSTRTVRTFCARVQQRRYEVPGFKKDGTNILCQGSTKTVRTFFAKVPKRRNEHLCQGSTKISTVVYYCMKIMPRFNKDSTNILCQGSTKTARTFYPGFKKDCTNILCQGSTKTVRTFVSGFNEDGANICARVQQI